MSDLSKIRPYGSGNGYSDGRGSVDGSGDGQRLFKQCF